MSKIIGITVGTQLPKPNFDQTDPTKGDYIRGDRSFLNIDDTLTKSGHPADAKAVGDMLKQSDWNQNDETAIDFIKNKPIEATDLEVVDILFSLDMMPTIVDASGAIITDKNNTFLLI